jgi:hypothetical protein
MRIKGAPGDRNAIRRDGGGRHHRPDPNR